MKIIYQYIKSLYLGKFGYIILIITGVFGIISKKYTNEYSFIVIYIIILFLYRLIIYLGQYIISFYLYKKYFKDSKAIDIQYIGNNFKQSILFKIALQYTMFFILLFISFLSFISYYIAKSYVAHHNDIFWNMGVNQYMDTPGESEVDREKEKILGRIRAPMEKHLGKLSKTPTMYLYNGFIFFIIANIFLYWIRKNDFKIIKTNIKI